MVEAEFERHKVENAFILIETVVGRNEEVVTALKQLEGLEG